MHDNCVTQRLADGHTAIKSHDGEKDTFCRPQAEEDEQLCYAGHIADASLMPLYIYQHLGDSRSSIAEI